MQFFNSQPFILIIVPLLPFLLVLSSFVRAKNCFYFSAEQNEHIYLILLISIWLLLWLEKKNNVASVF